LLRSSKSVAEKACHAFASTTQVGLIQALDVMAYLHEVNSFDSKLARLRESSLFYLKLDFGITAAIATAASAFKLDGNDLLFGIVQFRYIAQAILWFIVYALAFELLITRSRNSSPLQSGVDPRKSELAARNLLILYTVQVFAHILLLVYCIGYIASGLDCLGHSCGIVPK
jgi:hypothetical protein